MDIFQVMMALGDAGYFDDKKNAETYVTTVPFVLACPKCGLFHMTKEEMARCLTES